uniref:DUF3475 domain-containing protein n=1 Tax=Strongyloides papillosus TaxID=174720 RepID=A0A0N5BBR5_STREA
MFPAAKMNICQRRSKTVCPDLKMGRTVPTNRLRNVNNAPTDNGELGTGGLSRVNALRRSAGHFKKMVEAVADEVSLNSLVDSIQACIIKESLNNWLGCKIPAIRELESVFNAEKKIIGMETLISEVVELGARIANDLKYLEGCKEAIDDFIREEINPVFAAIERKKELLDLAD